MSLRPVQLDDTTRTTRLTTMTRASWVSVMVDSWCPCPRHDTGSLASCSSSAESASDLGRPECLVAIKPIALTVLVCNN